MTINANNNIVWYGMASRLVVAYDHYTGTWFLPPPTGQPCTHGTGRKLAQLPKYSGLAADGNIGSGGLSLQYPETAEHDPACQRAEAVRAGPAPAILQSLVATHGAPVPTARYEIFIVLTLHWSQHVHYLRSKTDCCHQSPWLRMGREHCR